MRRLVPLLLLCAAILPSATLDEAARELGRRVLGRLGAEERLALQTRAIPPVASAERDEVERGLRETLGRHWAAAGGQTVLRVAVSAALAHRVLVAEFRRGDDAAIMMADYDTPAMKRLPMARPLLEKSLLWEQDDQILDVAAAGGDGGFWVLDSERLALHDRQGQTIRQVNVRREGIAWPRDVRGRLEAGADGVKAWLPGQECRELRCAAGAGAWPVAPGLEAPLTGANEFSSAAGGRFFSAARVNGAALVLAGVDGKLRWNEAGAMHDLEAASGSDLAGLANPCGAGSIVVASSKDGRSLMVLEPVQRALRPAGEGMMLPGTLSALWPAGEDSAAATAVVRTAAGRYAAYRIFANCGR